ncbi:hypothetical protein [Burkholderia gladioli]|uniref:hypothetical protein n=1 Tax=Burkholderia gladioli TaxID=28095 RepID=UPI00163EF029|nr:hypothetical protein [Burkholderia gladioli]
MDIKLLKITTNRELLADLAAAADRRPSQDELTEQRVSYVMGFVRPGSVTREHALKVIDGTLPVGVPL